MLKLCFCLRRLPSLTREQFQEYWRTAHAPLVRRHAAALGVRRYVQSNSASDPRFAGLAKARGSAGLEFDGVAELWFDDAAAMARAGATPEGRAAGAALLADEAKFIDLANSPIFVTEENVVIAGPTAPDPGLS